MHYINQKAYCDAPRPTLQKPSMFFVVRHVIWFCLLHSSLHILHGIMSLIFVPFPAQNSSCRHSPSLCKPCKIRENSWGSPGLGGVRIAGLTLQPDSWTVKIQDWRLRPVSGRDFLGVEGKLGDTDVQISYHFNRLYVTLTLSGVYINRRVLVRRTTYTSTIIP